MIPIIKRQWDTRRMISRSKSPSEIWNMFLLIRACFSYESNIISSSVHNTVFTRAFYKYRLRILVCWSQRSWTFTESHLTLVDDTHCPTKYCTDKGSRGNHSLASFHCWNNILDIHKLKEEKLILAHSFRYFGPWWAGSKAGIRWKSMAEKSRSPISSTESRRRAIQEEPKERSTVPKVIPAWST